MNKRTRRLLIDIVIAIIIALGLFYAVDELNAIMPSLYPAIFLISLFWLSFRYGLGTAIVASLVVGLSARLIFHRDYSWMEVILMDVLPLSMTLVGGFFARNIHRTINNRRYQSTALNIYTASLLGSFGFYLLRFTLVPLALKLDASLMITSKEFWLNFLFSSLLIGTILFVIGRSHHHFILPSRSPYLSRKETSRLLND